MEDGQEKLYRIEMEQQQEIDSLKLQLDILKQANPNTVLILEDDLRLVKMINVNDDVYRYVASCGVGKLPSDLFPGKENDAQFEKVRQAARSVLDTGKTEEFTYHIFYEGSDHYYYATLTLYRNKWLLMSTKNISYLRGQLHKTDFMHDLIYNIIDYLPIGIFIKDAADDFSYLYWNKFMEDMTGIRANCIEGKNDRSVSYDALISAEKRMEVEKYIVRTGETVEFHGRLKVPDGTVKDIEVSKHLLALKNNKPLLLVIWRDITSKVDTEEALKRIRILNKMVLKLSDIRTCSIFVNPESRDYSDSEVQIYKTEAVSEEMFTVPWKKFVTRIHPDDRAEYEETFRKLCRGEMSECRNEVRLKLKPDSTYSWREAFAFVYERDSSGRPTVVLGCSVNVQERKEREAYLSDAMSKAEKANLLKSKYLANMSHEIRTPLNAITGFSELLAFSDSDEERQAYYEVIKANNELLMQLVNDILDISKIEADTMKISYQPVHLGDFLQEIYVSAQMRMPAQVELVLELTPDEPELITDPVRLMQLINNLLNNAMKNTVEGSITFGYKMLDDRIKFYVKDTGIGISRDRLHTIFDRYVKINDYKEGIGLGLAICQGLVDLMNGRIYVESEEGKGSVFSFELPVRPKEYVPGQEEINF